MTNYSVEWLLDHFGQIHSRPADLDWHRNWWLSCAGDPEASAFRRAGQVFPFTQRDVGTDDGPHDYPHRQIGTR
jgi:hypothetical protein